jgi:acetolactate synthase-1/3 small subunit
MGNANDQTQRHVFAVIVDDEPGVLARVIGLFSGRGYNIESLTVASVDAEKAISRITIVSTGTPMILEQIEAQLNRLVPIRKVVDLTRQGEVLEREMALLKVNGDAGARGKALDLVKTHDYQTIDESSETSVFQVSGTADELNKLVDRLRPLGLAEVVRSGVLGVARGKAVI